MITGGQRTFINRALPVLKKDERIVGVALGGSYARDAMDEYSGLDFIIAVLPEAYESILPDRVGIAEKLGKLLSCFTAEHIQRPEILICMYQGEPILHVDLNFQPLDKISTRLEDQVVLYEKDGLMSAEYAKQEAEIPAPDLQWYEDRFWIWVHYIANRIGRGELFDAIEGLSFLRQRVLGPLLLMKNGRPPWGVRHLEAAAPIELPRLIATLTGHDQESCIKALKAAADLYIYLRGYNKARLANREEAQRAALKYLNTISDKIL
ncbi:MAG: nucleotidyltransferase domain-containing protein [Oscillospiraceae bacterium]|nr:nucleotidyltransferase domain-containing protein [Oscillospiraceae bacterium]